MYFYGARWYDSYLNRFTSPDSIIPQTSQGVQAWDRYAYSNNNPIRYTDPSGHCIDPSECDVPPQYPPGPPYRTTSTSDYTPIPIFTSQNSNATIIPQGATGIGSSTGSQPAAALPLFGPDAVEFLGNAASNGSSILPVIASAITKGSGAEAVADAGTPSGIGAVFGGIASGITQAYEDRNIPLTPAQRVGRVAVTTVVKGGQSAVASVVGVSMAAGTGALGIETGPLDVAVAAGGYVVGYAATMQITSGPANNLINKLYSQIGLTPY